MRRVILTIFLFIFCLSWAEVKVEKALKTTSIKESDHSTVSRFQWFDEEMVSGVLSQWASWDKVEKKLYDSGLFPCLRANMHRQAHKMGKSLQCKVRNHKVLQMICNA